MLCCWVLTRGDPVCPKHLTLLIVAKSGLVLPPLET